MSAGLERLAKRIAEGADPYPPVKVIAGGSLFAGQIGTRQQAEELQREEWGKLLYDARRPKRRQKAEEIYTEVIGEASEFVKRLEEDSAEEGLLLLNCQVWPSGRDVLEVAVVHLPYASIDAWWIGSAKALPSGSGGIFIGGLMPIGQ